MDLQNEKCVMVINENLPLGIIANTAAIMGITLGKQMPEVVGADVYDRTGNGHLGIIEFPVPILKGNVEVNYILKTAWFIFKLNNHAVSVSSCIFYMQ